VEWREEFLRPNRTGDRPINLGDDGRKQKKRAGLTAKSPVGGVPQKLLSEQLHRRAPPTCGLAPTKMARRYSVVRGELRRVRLRGCPPPPKIAQNAAIAARFTALKPILSQRAVMI